jgi:hypothetical protein
MGASHGLGEVVIETRVIASACFAEREPEPQEQDQETHRLHQKSGG